LFLGFVPLRPTSILFVENVIGFNGEMITDTNFVHFIHDINLLASLGVRLVLVHGARPQIQLRLDESQLETQTVMDIRVTDAAAL